MKTRFIDSELKYTGLELSPHWIYRHFDILGDALVSFCGKADLKLESMVDLEDVKKKANIYSPRMLHFIGEWFVDSLDLGILLQHLFMCEVYECLLERKIAELERRGNDVYCGGRKLSVSIATKSPVSVLMHAGINIENENTPVPTSCLRDLGVLPTEFAKNILSRFEADWNVWKKSRVKVLSR